jgi:hypothetical protein
LWQGQAGKNTGYGGKPNVDLIDSAGGRVQAIEFVGARFSWWSDEFEQWFVDELVVCDGEQQSSGGQACRSSAANLVLTSGEQGAEQ